MDGGKEDEEPEILCEFFNFLTSASSTIQYNGRRFDQPYLEARYKKHNLPSPFGNLPVLDLYQELKPCKDLLKLERMKQPDLEEFLGLNSRLHCDGGQCIRLYKSYIKIQRPSLNRPSSVTIRRISWDLAAFFHARIPGSDGRQLSASESGNR